MSEFSENFSSDEQEELQKLQWAERHAVEFMRYLAPEEEPPVPYEELMTNARKFLGETVVKNPRILNIDFKNTKN